MENKTFYGCIEKDGHTYMEPYIKKGEINQFYGKNIIKIEQEFCKYDGTIFIFTFSDNTKMYLHVFPSNGKVGGDFHTERPENARSYLESEDINFHKSVPYMLHQELS